MASRIRRHMEEKNKHTIVFSMIGLVVLLFLLVVYGVPLFTNFILFLGRSKGTTIATSGSPKIDYIAPPILDETYSATNSASVTIIGNALKGQKIKLYVNGSVADQKQTDDKGKFSFDNVRLNSGDNDIKAKAVGDDNKESSYSNDLSIAYKNKGPNLTVDAPLDNQTFSGGNSRTLYVSGSTDTDSKVTVNGFWAIADNKGKFNYGFQLQNGDNNIKVIATDTAGNTTTVERHVTYNP